MPSASALRSSVTVRAVSGARVVNAPLWQSPPPGHVCCQQAMHSHAHVRLTLLDAKISPVILS